MQNLDRYRAMESLCRQSAVFRPLESWRLLAEAEMWHHKALEEISRYDERGPAWYWQGTRVDSCTSVSRCSAKRKSPISPR